MNLKSLIGKAQCHFFGHKRGRSIGKMATDHTRMCYACPRCGASWTRPIKPPKKLREVK